MSQRHNLTSNLVKLAEEGEEDADFEEVPNKGLAGNNDQCFFFTPTGGFFHPVALASERAGGLFRI